MDDNINPITSDTIDESKWGVETNNEFGDGVFSVHRHFEHAEHNASLVDGVAVPLGSIDSSKIESFRELNS